MFTAKFLEDGVIIVRVGTNGNCGGVGTIVAEIAANQQNEINFLTADFECDHFEGYGWEVAGAKLPPEIKEDIFSGAKQAFQENNFKRGIDFKLINASLNISDFVGKKFWTAGFEAVRFWLENQTRK